MAGGWGGVLKGTEGAKWRGGTERGGRGRVGEGDYK